MPLSQYNDFVQVKGLLLFTLFTGKGLVKLSSEILGKLGSNMPVLELGLYVWPFYSVQKSVHHTITMITVHYWKMGIYCV